MKHWWYVNIPSHQDKDQEDSLEIQWFDVIGLRSSLLSSLVILFSMILGTLLFLPLHPTWIWWSWNLKPKQIFGSVCPKSLRALQYWQQYLQFVLHPKFERCQNSFPCRILRTVKIKKTQHHNSNFFTILNMLHYVTFFRQILSYLVTWNTIRCPRGPSSVHLQSEKGW